MKRSGIDNITNTPGTGYRMGSKAKKHHTHESQEISTFRQVTTRLLDTDKTIWHRQP